MNKFSLFDCHVKQAAFCRLILIRLKSTYLKKVQALREQFFYRRNQTLNSKSDD